MAELGLLSCSALHVSYVRRHLSAQNSCFLRAPMCCAFRWESTHCFFPPCKYTCPFLSHGTCASFFLLPSDATTTAHSLPPPLKPSPRAAPIVPKSLHIALPTPSVFCPGLAESGRWALDKMRGLSSLRFLTNKYGWKYQNPPSGVSVRVKIMGEKPQGVVCSRVW